MKINEILENIFLLVLEGKNAKFSKCQCEEIWEEGRVSLPKKCTKSKDCGDVCVRIFFEVFRSLDWWHSFDNLRLFGTFGNLFGLLGFLKFWGFFCFYFWNILEIFGFMGFFEIFVVFFSEFIGCFETQECLGLFRDFWGYF